MDAADSTETPRDLPAWRIGHGYDLHRLATRSEGGRPLVLGGVRFDHDRGPVSHSDGDVLLHALTDALLGAVAAPDIGRLFPNDDPQNEGRSSDAFVEAAMEAVRAAGYGVSNVDITVILERPKLGGARETIRATVAALTGAPAGCVNVKGKTGEGVGPVGEGRAAEAHVVVLLHREEPDSS